MDQQAKISTRKFVASAKLLSIELIIVLIAFFASLATVLFFIKLIFLDKEEQFDLNVFDLLKPYINDNSTAVMNFFTFFGSQYFLIPANLVLILYMFFVKKDKWFAIRVLSVAISSLLLMFMLKIFFQRPRPPIPLLDAARGLSFPSGHAFMSFAFFGLLIYMAHKKITQRWLRYTLIIFFFLMTVGVGLSRIYLRVHYASDVFVGFSISLVWLVISLIILQRIERYKTKLPPIQ